MLAARCSKLLTLRQGGGALASVLVVVLTAAGPAAATTVAEARPAAAAPPPSLPPATYRYTCEELSIPMDDGVRLGATVTFPSRDGKSPAPGRFPVALTMTPYGRSIDGCGATSLFAERGIVGAEVDVRGTGGSDGNLDANYFSPREQRDGYQLVEYFGTRPWSSGKVGMFGGSYQGITQLLTAEQQPPHLAAITPDVVLSDLYRDAYTHGGIPDLFFDAQYLGLQGALGAAGINTAPNLAGQTVRAKLDQATSRSIALDYLARPDDGAFYHARSPYYRLDQIKVPVLILDGWRDGFVRGAIEDYRTLARRKGVETRLYVDPCTHKGCGGVFAPTTNPPGVENGSAAVFEFLAKYLLGRPTPPRSNVQFYVQPASGYLSAPSWPPAATAYRKLWLAPSSLASEPPVQASTQHYLTNPLSGLSMALDEYGTVAASPYLPTDQRLETGHGLTWRSPVLESALTLAGPVQLHLVAASTATDTDWTAKLADVAPDGSERLISQGYLRASHRRLDLARSSEASPYHTHTDPAPIKPGRYYTYDLAVYPTAYRLGAGHRLQLRLTTYDLPTHAPATLRLDLRNLAGGIGVTPILPAMNTVQYGPGGSWLLIPAYRG